MSKYAVFFDYKGRTYRLPVNPADSVKVTSTQANEKYEALGLGQIVVPTGMELEEYSFTAELPHAAFPYVETSGQFKGPDYYLALFKSWREHLVIPRFICRNGITKDINTLVLMEEIDRTENAGEEGDWYVDFKLLQYKDFGKRSVVVKKSKAKSKKSAKTTKNPKSKSTYTVRSGDTLYMIAKKVYGDGSKYTTIYNANKSKLKSSSILKVGTVLTIP